MTNAQLQDLHQTLWNKIPPAWPMKSIVAVNALSGFIDHPFEDALQKAESVLSLDITSKALKALNHHTSKWCQAFFDEGQATFPMPNKEKGLYPSIKEALLYDTAVHHNQKTKVKWLKALPKTPQACVAALIPHDLSSTEQSRYLSHLVCTLPGWASHVRYSAWHSEETASTNLLWGFTAIRLVISHLLDISPDHVLQHTKTKPLVSPALLQGMAQNEQAYQKHLIGAFQTSKPIKKVAPLAQFVFCIDVRSEPMRRALEQVGCETFGMAGFFGLPVAFQDQGQPSKNHCPVILKPSYTVPRALKPDLQKDQDSKQAFYKSLYQSVKYNFTTPFATAELLGPYSGLVMFLKNIWPQGIQKLRDWGLGKKQRQDGYTYDLSVIPFPDKVDMAKAVVSTLGIKNFAPYVVITGHASTTENNAFASSLQCGACGGYGGSSNADILAELCNDPTIQKKVGIPTTTTFISATHDTTQNRILTNTVHADVQAIIQKAHKNIGTSNKELKNSYSWHNVRPEWGLARNAVFIVGRRSLTESLNLEGRSFLHSYDSSIDKNGQILSTIIGGPVFVGHWINSQYLLSTANNKIMGTGSKITTNVTGKLGFLQGNGGDLFHGLSFQSLFKGEKKPYHEIMRLHVMLEAPRTRIETILKENETFNHLVTNQWIHLFQIDPKDHHIQKLSPKKEWTLVS